MHHGTPSASQRLSLRDGGTTLAEHLSRRRLFPRLFFFLKIHAYRWGRVHVLSFQRPATVVCATHRLSDDSRMLGFYSVVSGQEIHAWATASSQPDVLEKGAQESSYEGNAQIAYNL